MQRTARPEMYTIGLAYLGFISLGLSSGLLGVAWPAMAAEFNVAISDQGILSLGATAGLLLASFYSGTLIYRIGTGRILMAGMAVIAACLLLVALNPAWAIMVILMLPLGIGGGMVDSTMNAYAAHYLSERVMNWLHACFGIGVTVAPLIMTAVYSAHLSWRVGYAIMCVLLGVITVVLLFTRTWWRSDMEAHTEAEVPAERMTMSDTLRMPVVWVGVAMLFMVAGLETIPGNWIFTLFTEGRGIPEVAAAQWVSVFWGSFTVGRIFFGAIISRVNTTTLIYICLIGAMGGALLLWWNVAPRVGFAGLTILGFCQAPIYPVLTSNTPRRVGKQHSANAIGFQVAGAGAGLALLPALAGIMSGIFSLEVIPPMVFLGGFVLLALYQLAQVMSAGDKRKVEDIGA